ncbi:MAG: hypothetical protein LBC02_03490, partial [Planctomycetaceae bacterium]|nr:hypothetical protein [Planctomycetaceae bacterium]
VELVWRVCPPVSLGVIQRERLRRKENERTTTPLVKTYLRKGRNMSDSVKNLIESLLFFGILE